MISDHGWIRAVNGKDGGIFLGLKNFNLERSSIKMEGGGFN